LQTPPGRETIAVVPKQARSREEDNLRLAGHWLLHDLEPALRDALIDRFTIDDVPAGSSLLEEGQPNSRLFVILKGAVTVKLPKGSRRVSEVKLATLKAGDIFGEYSLFDGRAVSATVYAVEPARVASLTRQALDAFVEGNSEGGRRLYESIVRILVHRLRAKDAELDIVTIG